MSNTFDKYERLEDGSRIVLLEIQAHLISQNFKSGFVLCFFSPTGEAVTIPLVYRPEWATNVTIEDYLGSVDAHECERIIRGMILNGDTYAEFLGRATRAKTISLKRIRPTNAPQWLKDQIERDVTRLVMQSLPSIKQNLKHSLKMSSGATTVHFRSTAPNNASNLSKAKGVDYHVEVKGSKFVVRFDHIANIIVGVVGVDNGSRLADTLGVTCARATLTTLTRRLARRPVRAENKIRFTVIAKPELPEERKSSFVCIVNPCN
ncbi:hypothetical protein VPEG_00022 [Vibrio phage SIO-2]|uniref:hypothetical protein n=1 Tax=Vibrio phage SIO-2 TaxID=700512 RepID=UPI0002357C3C|nr:hypothetical protein VPEG_00022 [Vibrio phage SIO-2]AET42173.1 hypothetical protein VPEG_00022 [Vibrio phage SIO-2]